ncbi:hypothetical protein C0991_011303 [Blastosporella zonata]|nr:hypothetical protein C0991_011303 [Blastosporella zonata]
MVIELGAMYSVLGALFIAAFATHSDLSNLIFLSISHIQGIAQLLIIIRVADSRAFDGTACINDGPIASLKFRVTASTANSIQEIHDLED